jgi:hypothetical protein
MPLSSSFEQLLVPNGRNDFSCKAAIFNLQEAPDCKKLEILLTQNPDCIRIDTMKQQLAELAKIRNAHKKLTPEDIGEWITSFLNGLPMASYGVWVYYPWSNQLVHTLNKDEFIEVRTSRNLYKITHEEQQLLSTKCIAIIGLSVGKSIALALATERTCGKMKLADFDSLDLSNLNRLNAGVQDIGLPKTIIAAREIAELDPFLEVELFQDGLTAENTDSFFGGTVKPDILIEECDSLDIKVMARYKARELRIPVVMDTNDRGMLDIERFDLEPERPILHGLMEGINPENLTTLTPAEKLQIVLKMINSEHISDRLKRTMGEVGRTVVSWPQLASAVYLGGALGAHCSRKILLNEPLPSGRFYIDLDELIN